LACWLLLLFSQKVLCFFGSLLKRYADKLRVLMTQNYYLLPAEVIASFFQLLSHDADTKKAINTHW